MHANMKHIDLSYKNNSLYSTSTAGGKDQEAPEGEARNGQVPAGDARLDVSRVARSQVTERQGVRAIL